MKKYNKIEKEPVKTKKDKYCCQLCNYPVISSKNKCCHRFCDYCLTTLYSSKLAECKICAINGLFIEESLDIKEHNDSFRQT